MYKIATHNSATGEKPLGLVSYFVIPFARTQSKTIREQYEVGCRMFDIRVRFHNNTLYCAHGLFITKRSAWDIINEINTFPEKCYVSITYEGKLSLSDIPTFKELINHWKRVFNNINWGEIAVKYTDNDIKVDWDVLIPSDRWERAIQGFLPLDGKTWQTYIPIPWLWKKIYFNKPKFNSDYYICVDFL